MSTIRPVRGEDSPAVALLLGQLGYPSDEAAVAGRLEGLLARPDHVVVVAEVEGRVVGVASLHLFPVLYGDGPTAQLTALVVEAGARGGGIGAALVRHLEAAAREGGATRIVVTTANHRSRTHVFYQHLGYEWTGRRYLRRLADAD